MAKLPKLSPQTELTLPPGTAVLPTTIASGGYIERVSSNELIFFAVLYLPRVNSFSIKYLQAYWQNG